MLLDTKNRSLQVIIATAMTGAGKIFCTVEYEDSFKEALTPRTMLLAAIVGTSQICPPPDDLTARRIIEIHIENGDVATHDVTVQILDAATAYTLKFSAALPVGKTLHYNRFNGWAVV